MIDLSREGELNEAAELLFFGYRSFTARPDRVLEQRGLARVHHRVLYFVGRNPGLSVTALLAILGVTKQALHAPLRQLIEMRLVMSAPSDRDRRVKELRLTEDGERLESQLTGSQRRLLDGVFATAGPDGESAWRTVMRTLAATEPGPGPGWSDEASE